MGKERGGERPVSARAETVCAHAGEDPGQEHGAVVPPIYQTSLFTYPDCESREAGYTLSPAGEPRSAPRAEAYDYTRLSNPTTTIAEAKLAALEHGEAARCFSSGMAAISAAILSTVRAGDHVVAPHTTYGPTRAFLSGYLERFNVEVSYVEGGCLDEWQDAIRPNTRMLYLESPSSLVMRQQDLAAVSSLARAHGAVSACDNSWASPIFQNPLDHGVDLVIHSATKYLGGHSDTLAGVVIGSEERIRKLSLAEGCLLGGSLDPFASWLLVRGLRTLPIRMERHQQTAREIAKRLAAHREVDRVYYPGLPGGSQPELTARQLRGTSGLMSIRLQEPSKKRAYAFVNRLRYFEIGCSWGGFESLALAVPEPAAAPAQPAPAGSRLIRLHIGLEHVDDLWDDLDQALGNSRGG